MTAEDGWVVLKVVESRDYLGGGGGGGEPFLRTICFFGLHWFLLEKVRNNNNNNNNISQAEG